tara:strand:+ start:37 stop:993 length:957 start_codon:yes stop_codon:yes gene_type:complete
MRIIEWNSQGAFRKKHEKILSHNPDILIIPECESEENLKFGKLTPKPNDFIWYGDSANKGIGIFSYSDFKLEILTVFNPNYRYIVPLRVSNPRGAFILLAIWAMDNKEFTETRYIGQIWLAINFYKNLLNLPIIITGDFNSNKIWDSKERVGNHTDMVNLLAKNKINSIYHSQEKEEQGKEENPTFHMYRKKDKPYHIDYFFASDHFFKNELKLKLGKFEEWNLLSDHVPLILDLKSPIEDFVFNETFSSLIKKQLSQLNTETQNRFNDLINDLSTKAKSLNKLDPFPDTIKERKLLTQKINWLTQINNIIEKINNVC